MDVLAILPVRNEAPYLANCLRQLIANGVDYAIVDNESTDDLDSILRRPEFRAHLVDLLTLPFSGRFEIGRVGEAFDEVAARSNADWILRVDADEVMHPYVDGETVAAALAVADAQGWNAVNFDEFVFLPVDRDYESDIDRSQPLRHYYFFEPTPRRLMRASRRDAGFGAVAQGHHTIRDPRLRLSPTNLVLRHYMFRSAEHAKVKYPTRRYDPAEVRLGWSRHRAGQPAKVFSFPPASALRCLAAPDDRNLDRSDPKASHYWQWGRRRPLQDRLRLARAMRG